MKQHVIAALLLFGACTKPNPIVCCTSEPDCNSIGVSDPDYDGSIRPQGAASDMGAFEFTP